MEKSSRRRRRKSRDEDDVGQKITEEEITEYLVKKAQKKAIKVSKKMKKANVSGYSNGSNPFGDSNLNERFVWGKKIERDVSQGLPLDMFSVKAEKKRQRERMAEVEKVKKRREERAIEKAHHEEERGRARAEYQGRDQSKHVLSKQHLNDGSDDFDIEINKLYMVFKGLTVKEIEELRDGIKMHRPTPTHVEFWEVLMVICDWELAEARKKDDLDRARVHGEEPPAQFLAEQQRGLHPSIETDVKEYLEGKTYKELEKLRSQVESQMRSGKAKVVEYWEALLTHLHIFKAKAYLKEIRDKLCEHLERPEQPVKCEELLESSHEEDPPLPYIEVAQQYSPEPMTIEDTHDLQGEPDSFSLEVYWWHDKYRPRKPKYSNRVHTGYEWNKYNQTHYDHDNPPPQDCAWLQI